MFENLYGENSKAGPLIMKTPACCLGEVFLMGVLAGSLDWWWSVWCCSFMLVAARHTSMRSDRLTRVHMLLPKGPEMEDSAKKVVELIRAARSTAPLTEDKRDRDHELLLTFQDY